MSAERSENNGLRRRGIQSINVLPAMASQELKESIKDMMVENLMLRTPKEEIGDDLPLFGPEGLGLDSIDALELVVSLEKHFSVTVPNSDVAKHALATVETIAEYVEAHRSA
jgi:acyl carrier protein